MTSETFDDARERSALEGTRVVGAGVRLRQEVFGLRGLNGTRERERERGEEPEKRKPESHEA